MKIKVFGAGYVGLSNAVMLSLRHSVSIYDIDKDKIKALKSGRPPFLDSLLESYLNNKKLDLTFELDIEGSLEDIDFVLIATPTNFNHATNSFDTQSIENTLQQVKQLNFSGLVVIRSTVPVGFTSKMQEKFNSLKIAFFPEFLREGYALEDNLFPSRIICGSDHELGNSFLQILLECSQRKETPSLVTSPSEAESIKLFSNSYLAMRIAFFNELDTFAESSGLNSKNIISGVSLDKRIGEHYNNPSFGYGGYCLPKDIKQLEQNFGNLPQSLIKSTISSNKLRKAFIVNEILKKKVKIIGIYRLSMKLGSDNWRESSIIEIMKELEKSSSLIIYEPALKSKFYLGIPIEKDFDKFIKDSDLIIANRIEDKIAGLGDKVYSRDIFHEN